MNSMLVYFVSKVTNFSMLTEHFEKNQFMNAKMESLVWNAVPTIFPNLSKPLTGKRPPPKVREPLAKKPPRIVTIVPENNFNGKYLIMLPAHIFLFVGFVIFSNLSVHYFKF